MHPRTICAFSSPTIPPMTFLPEILGKCALCLLGGLLVPLLLRSICLQVLHSRYRAQGGRLRFVHWSRQRQASFEELRIKKAAASARASRQAMLHKQALKQALARRGERARGEMHGDNLDPHLRLVE